jgi:hypothetical protein
MSSIARLRYSLAVFVLTTTVFWSTAHDALARQAVPPTFVTITGTVTDARNLPIVGAVITAHGTAVGWTATLANGSFVLHVPPGSYDILVRKGGYTPQTAMIVIGPKATRSLSLELTEASLRSLSTGSANPSISQTLNPRSTALATLAASTMSERPDTTLQALALELPGVTLAHSADSVPDTSLVVRGGTVETRVQIDGHAVSAGATGRWDSSYAALPLFDSIEVAKGAGFSGANAGESAFGTVNLHTHDFTRGSHEDLVSGVDSYGGSFTTLGFSGNLFRDARLSYVFEHSVDGSNGPEAGKVADNVVAESNNTALLVSKTPLDSPFTLGSDLAKIRWRFTSSTSLTLGYVGIHADYAATGGAFGTYQGQQTVIPCATSQFQGLQCSSPLYPGLIGTTVPAYTLAHNTSEQTNQPLFEAELRTAFRNDTLLLRPYVGTIFNLLDGSGRSSGPDPSSGGAWKPLAGGGNCSSPQECVPNSGLASLIDQEVDRLHGTTVTLLHSLGDGTLNLSYDYRSDQTRVTSGDPNLQFNDGLEGFLAYLPSIPTTLSRNCDWSATYVVPLSNKMRAAFGDYYTDWKLNYGTVTTVENFLNGTAIRTVGSGNRSSMHHDPHIGFSWQPKTDTSYRFTAGSAITLPYADLVAGSPSFSGEFTALGTVGQKNPALQPETTIAYDVGTDRRFGNGSVGTLDAFDNTIHNVFANQVSPFNGALFGVPPGLLNGLFATTTLPLNAPIERNYGLEFGLTKTPIVGLGYRVATTLQRAYLTQLPASFFSARSSLVNGKQLDGATSIPYVHGYAELTYGRPSGFAASLGADYTGSNNWTNGPAFMVWNSMLRYDLRGGYRAQLSIENLLNADTGNDYAAGTAVAGFATVDYGSAAPSALPTYGAAATTRFAIAPRTYRLQVEVHLGH